MLNKNRVDECFWIFSNTLPIGANQTKKLIEVFGEDVSKLLPELFSKLGKVCIQYPEEFEGYLDMIKHMIEYSREDTDQNPIEFVDISEEEKEKMLKHMRIQIGQFTKQ